MINKIKLHNFKSYRDQEFELSNLTVFCGNNSVGKSTAIQALSIPLQSKFRDTVSLNGDLIEVGTIEDIHHLKAQDDSLLIEFSLGSNTISWGYQDYEEQSKQSNKQLVMLEGTDEAIHLLGRILDNFQYLEAERLGPRANYEIAKSNSFHNDWLGAKGEFTSEFLSRTDRLSRLLVGGVFHAKEEVSDPRLHADSLEDPSLARHIDAWMKEISPGISVTSRLYEAASTSVNVFGQNGNNDLKPLNVGFGVSYVLSIVTALLYTRKGGLVVIENPEAHLHPRGQSYLGRLIALTAQAGVQVIVETHSDHLLNGIRVATRLEEEFDPKLFTLYYISQGVEQSNVEKITISKDGKLSNWPDGFFDQQAQDMFMIMTGQAQLPTKGD
ncbi:MULTISPECIES: DUF3696 domain-containing protein [Vibrio harveyi group]|uniref:DUF3696 domain-containing protein n=1 Tax=Vibrio harveyi group TaxID=717610 RepID=UPI00069D4C8A|nr:DUF3696 domain-containing protein [Vibrio harveyi]APP05217.1 hypothetical protein BG259_07610 [Vibrio harveyi]KNY41208.1 hypothetical protein AKG94_19755 [Vibrio harveyi]